MPLLIIMVFTHGVVLYSVYNGEAESPLGLAVSGGLELTLHLVAHLRQHSLTDCKSACRIHTLR